MIGSAVLGSNGEFKRSFCSRPALTAADSEKSVPPGIFIPRDELSCRINLIIVRQGEGVNGDYFIPSSISRRYARRILNYEPLSMSETLFQVSFHHCKSKLPRATFQRTIKKETTEGEIKYTITKNWKGTIAGGGRDRRRYECAKRRVKDGACIRGANVPPHVHAPPWW